jgi:hypothetical protein
VTIDIYINGGAVEHKVAFSLSFVILPSRSFFCPPFLYGVALSAFEPLGLIRLNFNSIRVQSRIYNVERSKFSCEFYNVASTITTKTHQSRLGVTYQKTYILYTFQILNELSMYGLLSRAWTLPGTVKRARVSHPAPAFLRKKSFDTRKNTGLLL